MKVGRDALNLRAKSANGQTIAQQDRIIWEGRIGILRLRVRLLKSFRGVELIARHSLLYSSAHKGR